MWSKNRNSKSGIWLVIGAIAGAIATLFLSTDEKGQTKKVVKDKVSLLKTRLKDSGDHERIKKIFGEKSKEAEKVYQNAKKELAERLAQIKGKVEDIDKNKYTKVVNEIVDELKKNTEATTPQLQKLSEYLKEDYAKLTKNKSAKKSKKA